MNEYTLRFEFLSDWGIGTGFGRTGEIDRIIAKDALGLPTVPAKTVTGIMRESCEEAAYALDGGNPAGKWHRWLDWLFGSQPAGKGAALRPKAAAMSIRPAELDIDIRQAVKADPTGRLAQATTVIRAGVEVNSVTGVAEDDTLRMEERARAELVATAPVAFDASPDSLPDSALALLASGAALVDTVGGIRRRGAGRCRVRLIDTTGGEVVINPAILASDPGPPPQPSSDPLGEQFQSRPISGTRHYSVDITCLTPIAAAASVKGNVVESLDYIPGYLLLPIFARAMGAGAAAAIADGSFRVSDANPVVDDVRLLPAPRCLEVAKGVVGSKPVHNVLDGTPSHRTVPLKDGWVNPQSALATTTVHRMRLVERSHAVIDDHAQRPTEDSGGLFVQQAIPAGTRLRFDVEAPTELELPKRARVGRAKKDDYGLVELTRRAATVPTTTRPPVPLTCHTCTVVAWCVSDVLLRDDQLRPTASAQALAQALADRLGVAMATDARVTAFHGVRRHATWSATWGLPRPSLVAIKAGTVVQFQLATAPTDDQVLDFEMTGIGERTAEGFGRVVINAQLLTVTESSSEHGYAEPGPDQITVRSSARGSGEHRARSIGSADAIGADCPAKPNEPGSTAVELWRIAVKSWIDDAALAAATRFDEPAELGLPRLSRSQLGLLRERVTQSTSQEIKLIGRLRKPGVDGGVNSALRALMKDPTDIWGYVGDPGSDVKDDAEFRRLARRLFLLYGIRAASRASQRSEAEAADRNPTAEAHR